MVVVDREMDDGWLYCYCYGLNHASIDKEEWLRVDPALPNWTPGQPFDIWLDNYHINRDRITNILCEETALQHWRCALHTWYLSVLDRQVPGPQNRGSLDTLVELAGRSISRANSSNGTLATFIKNNASHTNPIIYSIVMLYSLGNTNTPIIQIPPTHTEISCIPLISAALCWFFWFSLRGTELYHFVFNDLMPGWDIDVMLKCRESWRESKFILETDGDHFFTWILPPPPPTPSIRAFYSFWPLMRNRFLPPLKVLQTTINTKRQNKERESSSSSSSSSMWNVAIKAKPAFNNNSYIQEIQVANDLCQVARVGPVVEFINSFIRIRRRMTTCIQQLQSLLPYIREIPGAVEGVNAWCARDAAISNLLGCTILDQLEDQDQAARLKARLGFLLRSYHSGMDASADLSAFVQELWTKHPLVMNLWLVLCDAFMDARVIYTQSNPEYKFQHDATQQALFEFGYCPVCNKVYTHCVGEEVGKTKRRGKKRDIQLLVDDDDDEEEEPTPPDKKTDDSYWNPSIGYDGAVIDLNSAPLYYRHCARQTARSRSLCIFCRIHEVNLWNKIYHLRGLVYAICYCCENMCVLRPGRYSTDTCYLCDHCFDLFHSHLRRINRSALAEQIKHLK